MPRHVPASVTELSRIGLLASLPGETLTRLAERMRREEIPPGRTIVAEGDDDRRFYALLSGMAAVAQSSLGPRRLLRPGETTFILPDGPKQSEPAPAAKDSGKP